MRWAESETGWVVCGGWKCSDKSQDLSQVPQLEWVIVVGEGDAFTFEAYFGGSDTWNF